MEYTQIKCDFSDGILTVMLNRPEKLNAYTVAMGNELADAFARADEDDEVRVVIVTGAGRAFCAGAEMGRDPADFGQARSSSASTLEGTQRLQSWIHVLYNLRKPVIAAINGHAVGIGLTMTLPMDFRLASEDARIGFIFPMRGLTPEAASTWFLPRIVGISKAADLLLTGRFINIREAVTCGLLNEVVPRDNVVSRAREIASEIVCNTSAIAVALTRQLLWKMLSVDSPLKALEIDSKIFGWALQQPDAREGIVSFLEKRPPRFNMRPSTDMPEFYPWWGESGSTP
jgi:enoyl-CoA hydratase/carnithine racemase